jgi:hypothetical protein
VATSVRLLFDEPDCSFADRFLDAKARSAKAPEDFGADDDLAMSSCLFEDVAVLAILVLLI